MTGKVLKIQFPLYTSDEPMLLVYDKDYIIHVFLHVASHEDFCNTLGLSPENPKMYCMGYLDEKGQLILDADTKLDEEDWPDW